MFGLLENRQCIAAFFCAVVVPGPPSGAYAEDLALDRAVDLPAVQLSATNSVPQCVTPDRLTTFLRGRNSRMPQRYLQLSAQYAKYGEKLGVRWDLAFFQMMLETRNLTFRDASGRPVDVTAGHNNFAGIGALGDGRPGEIFATQIQGVRGHLEHVLHYSGAQLPAPVAERTRKVQIWRVLESWHAGFRRPITFTDLALRWAPNVPAYLASLEEIAGSFEDQYCTAGELLTLRPGRRRPMIASTGWQFQRTMGPAGTAGATPPTGRPELKYERKALGAARIGAASASPPIPSFNRTPLVPVREQAKPKTSVAPRRLAALPSVKRQVSVSPTKEPVYRERPKPRRPRISADDRVRQLVSDRKIMLTTHVGAVIPIVFHGNGRMQGNGGSLSFFLGASRDRGRWWVAKGKLCQKWRVWLDRETHCIRLRERRGVIYWQADDGKRGTARVVSK